MADIDLSGLNIDQLADLVTQTQTEMASREKKRRKDLRHELERRVTAEGYKMGDIFPELAKGGANGTAAPEAPGQVPQSAEPGRYLEWHRSHSEGGSAAIVGGARDRRSRLQGDPDVPDSTHSDCARRGLRASAGRRDAAN